MLCLLYATSVAGNTFCRKRLEMLGVQLGLLSAQPFSGIKGASKMLAHLFWHRVCSHAHLPLQLYVPGLQEMNAALQLLLAHDLPAEQCAKLDVERCRYAALR
jgi:hypothetical protein